MADSDIRDNLRPVRPPSWPSENESTAAANPDIRTPVPGFSAAVQWGLASLLLGCSLLLASCVTMVVTVMLFRGVVGIHPRLALTSGLIGVGAVTVLGLASLLFGYRGLRQAFSEGT